MACLSQALRLGGLLPPHNAFQDTFLTMRDGPHRSCPRAQRVPVHPKVFPHSYLPLSRHSERLQSRLNLSPPAFPSRPSRGRPPRAPRGAPYPILRRLSSTSHSRAAPRSAWLQAALAG